MKKKVLFVATVDSHIEAFHLPYLKMFKECGYKVHVATDSDKPIKYCDKKIKLSIKRSPFSFSNLKAIRELKEVVNVEKYEIIHCHTPMGGVVTRLAAKNIRKSGTRVIYTAHGFHFYKGAPVKNWLMFYPVEKYLAKYTDTLITINNEDFERAKKKFGKRCFDIQYIPGIGVDEKKFTKKIDSKEKNKIRESLGLNENDKVIICVGRLDKNKNQGLLIKMMPMLLEKDKQYHLLLVGPDELNGKYQKIVERLGVSRNVHFLGFRDDVPELLQISDVAISSSKQEGLPVNLMEAVFFGIPVVATDCRGNRDVIMNSNDGDCEAFLLKKEDGTFIKKVKNALIMNNKIIESNRRERFVLRVSLDNVSKKMAIIYGLVDKDDFNSKISIIIPVHNSGKFLEKCLTSVCNQEYKNLEIVVVVDASTDNSLDICKKFAKNDARIVLKKVAFNSPSKTRNCALNLCTGDYVGFIDSDDYVDECMYFQMLKVLKLTDSDIAACNFYFEDEGGDNYRNFGYSNKDFSRNNFPDEIQRNKCMQGYIWNKLYKKDLIENGQVRFDEDIFVMEDDLFNYRIYDFNKNFAGCFLNKKLYHYVKHDTSLTKTKYGMNSLTMFVAKEREIDILDANGKDADSLKAEFVSLFARDLALMKKAGLQKTALFEHCFEIFVRYKSEIQIMKLPFALKKRFVVAKFSPFLYKIWLVKTGRMGNA